MIISLNKNLAKLRGGIFLDFGNCPDFFRDYLFYQLTIKGRSERTVQGYYTDLRGFLKYCYFHKNRSRWNLKNQSVLEVLDQIELDQITIDLMRQITLSDVYEYLNYTLTEKKNTAKTRARKISSIRSLYKYLTVTVNLVENNPVKNLDTPSQRKTVPKYLSLEESIQLLSQSQQDTDTAPRDYCILMLFLNCGMRLSELVGINLSDIKGNQLKLLGKGNKERMVYLNDGCMEALQHYLEFRSRQFAGQNAAIKDKDALFLSNRGTRITNRRIQQIITDLLKKSQLDGKGYSVHKLRHTAATLMYQYGHVDIRVLKEILGHANVGTTEIYTHVSNAQLETALQNSPLSQMRPAEQKENRSKKEKD